METKVKQPTAKQLAMSIAEFGDAKLLSFFADTLNPEKMVALAKQLECTLEEALTITESAYDTFEYGSEEYLILTDSEADDANDQSIDNYIDECILPELPEQYRRYFDDEAFKNDARHDGRGNNLATYDGNEEYQDVDRSTYYIYRTN